MRVILMHWTLPPTVGGVETHLVDLAAGLAEAGASVTLISGEERPDESLFPSNVEVLHEPALSQAAARDVTLRSVEALSMQRRLVSLEPDVVHAHNLFPLAGRDVAIALEALSRRTGAALIHTSHSEWEPKPGTLRASAWNSLLSVSIFLSQRLYKYMHWVTTVTRPPVDSARFHTESNILDGGQIRLLHPSRLIEEKGLRLSINLLGELVREGVDASLTLTDPPSTFDLSGHNHRLRAELQLLVAGRGLADRIKFVSPSLREMPHLYDQSDIVLYPSLFQEPYGLVPLEAMSSRRPVVASAVGGMVETIRHGETGLLVRSGDSLSLLNAVQRLLDDHDFARRIGETGRKHVQDNYGLMSFCECLMNLYEQGLGRRD